MTTGILKAIERAFHGQREAVLARLGFATATKTPHKAMTVDATVVAATVQRVLKFAPATFVFA